MFVLIVRSDREQTQSRKKLWVATELLEYLGDEVLDHLPQDVLLKFVKRSEAILREADRTWP
jgi:ATP/maltotriose-dependent transcriptional regulator MalT